ncbi:MAG: DNA polymerase III subunit gamma/tau, partial [Muribaculaceae bacterium]|nr:DNA polymerase III subunit gamma/tau [Muribaculaceae bacterium]
MPENNQRYIVSARKYRPATFQTVVGQKNLTSTLKNAISSGRLAQAYLFCGPRGVGKTSCARIFAKTINCLHPTPDGEACGECESCRAIDQGNSYNLIELDAASNNGVDDIRAITEQVSIPPQVGKYRVFIIDEVHMLTAAAFNALLKTLEEPPSYVIFILATTEKHKVIPTILSRCQIYDFKRITIDDTVDHLEFVAKSEGIKAERRALSVIARKADGAMRDALSIFDQVAASCQGDVTYESTIDTLNVLDYEYYFRLVDAFAKADIPDSLLIYKEIRDKGFDSLFFIGGLASHIRDLMVAADARTLPLLEMPADTAQRFRQQATSLPLQWYYAAMKILNDCDFNYRTASNKQLLVEVTLIRLCQLLAPAEPPFKGTYKNPRLQNPATAPAAPPG